VVVLFNIKVKFRKRVFFIQLTFFFLTVFRVFTLKYYKYYNILHVFPHDWANPMQTPAAIVPEWYLLPFYAILRSIPNKLLGVIAMFSAILILLLLSVTDVSRSRGMQFRPLSKLVFFAFTANFLILMQLGSKHVESPFIELGQVCTVLYFLYFSAAMLGLTNLENTVVDLKTENSSKKV